jgi:hypothetical protein
VLDVAPVFFDAAVDSALEPRVVVAQPDENAAASAMSIAAESVSVRGADATARERSWIIRRHS